jgi:thiosulfate dehydrogenase [quinone] large subunit
LIVGIALIIGAFTGIAAFFGIFMNWHYVMAGAASTNAMLLAVGLVLVLAWKTAGWIGADRSLLPLVGTPWQPAPYRLEMAPRQRPVAAEHPA